MEKRRGYWGLRSGRKQKSLPKRKGPTQKASKPKKVLRKESKMKFSKE